MPVELVFILQRWAEMAEADPSLRDRQPWKAASRRDYAFLAGAIDKHYAGRRHRREGADGRRHRGVRGDGGRGVRRRPRRSSSATASTRRCSGRSATRRLPADGRAAALPRGQRVHDVHRVGRQPRLHARLRRRHLRPPAGADHRLLERAAPGSRTATARSSTRPRPTSSTTARPSRSGSGAGSVGGRSSPAATRTATSRCSPSPERAPGRACGSSSSTTTPSES